MVHCCVKYCGHQIIITVYKVWVNELFNSIVFNYTSTAELYLWYLSMGCFYNQIDEEDCLNIVYYMTCLVHIIWIHWHNEDNIIKIVMNLMMVHIALMTISKYGGLSVLKLIPNDPTSCFSCAKPTNIILMPIIGSIVTVKMLSKRQYSIESSHLGKYPWRFFSQ